MIQNGAVFPEDFLPILHPILVWHYKTGRWQVSSVNLLRFDSETSLAKHIGPNHYFFSKNNFIRGLKNVNFAKDEFT